MDSVRLRVEICARVALPQPSLPLQAVHPHAAVHSRAGADAVQPADHVRVRVRLEEDVARHFPGHVPPAEEGLEPGVHGDVRDRVLGPAEVLPVLEALICHVDCPLHLHGVPVDGVLHLPGRVGVEVPEPAADERRRGHLPHQPADALRAGSRACRDEAAVLVGEVQQDRARLEDTDRAARVRPVHQRRDFRVWVRRHEARGELVAGHDVDRPGVVLDAQGLVQLLEQNGHLLAVGRPQAVQLERVPALGQGLLGPCARRGAVDPGESVLLRVVLPHAWRHIGSTSLPAASSRRQSAAIIGVSDVRSCHAEAAERRHAA
eukprot:CAMPEP_0179295384 /NCGR_PEP_ID=MMETSP0797-20121207/44397_1 /TAXON_ID=47934 /ORGANISM="Dinophysis acuminata, Strain DAEP01" /LENGTH=318 /DNA_ID=CAMNT_0021004633 /DNA_START=16 /DNA_END=969 /DNA_ORIENTATION=+